MATHSSVLAWRIPGKGGTWWAAVYGVTQSRTRLKWLSSTSSNIPDLYPLDANWHPLIVKIEMSLDIDKSAFGGNVAPGWEPLHAKFWKLKDDLHASTILGALWVSSQHQFPFFAFCRRPCHRLLTLNIPRTADALGSLSGPSAGASLLNAFSGNKP